MLARVFKENQFHSIFASRTTEFRIIIILILEFINLGYKFLLVDNLLIISRLLLPSIPKITKDDALAIGKFI